MTGRPEPLVYITCVPLTGNSGGSIVCRQHVERLAAVQGQRLIVCTIGSVEDEAANKNLVAALGAEHRHITLIDGIGAPRSYQFRPSYRWHLLFERHAFSHAFTEERIARVVDEFQASMVAVDYLHTTFFAKFLFDRPLHRVIITLNPEARFFAEMRRLGRVPAGGCSDSKIAERRLEHYEDWVYRNSSAVVALTAGDLPQTVPSSVERVVISPVLPESPTSWSGEGNKTVLFVGNWGHHPNYSAIQWLAEKFAPELLKKDPQARLKIVGAAAADVPAHWRVSNIDFLGTSTAEEVKRLFTTADLFIAPIENDYGSKIKVLECLSYGTPLVATPQALTGAAFAASAIPAFGLDEPERAAKLVAELLPDCERLKQLSSVLKACAKAQDISVGQTWQALIDRLRAKPLPPPARWPLSRRVEAWIWD